MTRYNRTSLSFNGNNSGYLDVPDPDYTSTFDYNNFDISSMSSATINNCEASTNSSTTDIRYDYFTNFYSKFTIMMVLYMFVIKNTTPPHQLNLQIIGPF